ncbi:hypothetical protein, partial [Alloprevotella tannerae]|uniref:hypothetical protein n=1 Tax=Alloprevotella tannerae TaxID=76122 RepID=UPI0028E95997
ARKGRLNKSRPFSEHNNLNFLLNSERPFPHLPTSGVPFPQNYAVALNLIAKVRLLIIRCNT